MWPFKRKQQAPISCCMANKDKTVELLKQVIETTMKHMREYYEDTHRCWKCGAPYRPPTLAEQGRPQDREA